MKKRYSPKWMQVPSGAQKPKKLVFPAQIIEKAEMTKSKMEIHKSLVWLYDQILKRKRYLKEESPFKNDEPRKKMKFSLPNTQISKRLGVSRDTLIALAHTRRKKLGISNENIIGGRRLSIEPGMEKIVANRVAECARTGKPFVIIDVLEKIARSDPKNRAPSHATIIKQVRRLERDLPGKSGKIKISYANLFPREPEVGWQHIIKELIRRGIKDPRKLHEYAKRT